MKSLISYILLICLSLSSKFALASDRDWTIHSIEDFNFYYQEDKSEYVNVLRNYFKTELYKLQNRINYHLNGKVDILLVNTEKEEMEFSSPFVVRDNNLGGTLIDKIDKLVLNVYDPPDVLIRKFRTQLVLLILQEMIYGGTFQDRIRTANMFYLPSWVIPGIVTYLGGEWHSELDSRWRLIYERYGIDNFNAIPDVYDAEKGASFWKFLSDQYGSNAITTVLYMTRLTRKFNAALYYSFQKTTNDLFKEWGQFYHKAYLSDQQKRMPVKGVVYSEANLYDLFIISESEWLVLIRERGVYKLKRESQWTSETVLQLEEDRRPLSKFSGSIQMIGSDVYCFVSDKLGYGFYQLSERKTKYYRLSIPSIRKVIVNKESLFLLSSSVLSSELFLLSGLSSLKGKKLKPLKSVIVHPGEYVSDLAFLSRGYVYFSRPFKGSSSVIRVREQSMDTIKKYNSDIRQMVVLDDSLLHFNGNKNGVYNGMVLNLNTLKLKYLTDYRSNILFHQIDIKVLAEFVANLEESSLFVTEGIPYSEYFVYDSLQPMYFNRKKLISKDLLITDEFEIMKDSLPEYEFLSPVAPEYDFTLSNYDSLKQAEDRLHLLDARIDKAPELYRPKLFYFQFFNELALNQDLPFSSAISEYAPNNVGIRFGAGFENQFNNKQLELSFYGFRVWSSRDVVFRYSNQVHLPFSVSVMHRQRLSYEQRFTFYKNGTNFIRFDWEVHRGRNWFLTHNLGARQDYRKLLATDSESLVVPDEYKKILETALNFNYQLNGLNSLRSRPWNVAMDLSFGPLYNFENKKSAFTSQLRFEVEKVFRPWLSVQGRINAGNSFGQGPIYFVIGGVSSDMLADYENRSFSDQKPAALYRMVYGVRGFPVNFRNGNSYGLVNIEAHFKLIELVYARPIVSELFDHMRFVIFADWASSLYGASIYDPANALNSNSFDTPGSTLSIEVRNIKNPMIGSTGWGIHTKIYSYTLRAEIAYAFENTEYYGSMFHLSLGYGF